MSRRLDVLWLCLAVLGLWELLYLRAGEKGIASPVETLERTGALFASSGFWSNAASTGAAFGLSVVIALLCGVALGLLLGFVHLAAEVSDPILNALAALPKITLYPIILLLFGLGLPARVAFGTIHALFPIVILTMNGVRTIKPVVRKSARAMHLSLAQSLRTVLLPAALPEIFTGLRVGIALALLGTLIGEMFAADRGIGFMLMQSVERQDSATITALTLLLFLVATAGGTALLAIDRRLHHR